MSARLAARDRLRPARAGAALAPGGPRRRHDAAGEAALEASTRARSTGSRRGSRRARPSSRRRTARRRRRAMAAEILGPRARLALEPLGREPRLGRRLHPARRARRRARACSRSTRARCRRSRAASARASSASATSSATSSTATASSSSSPSGGAPPSPSFRRHAVLVVNADDPQVGDLARERASTLSLRARRPAPRPCGPAARGRLEVLHPLRHAVRVRGGLRRAPRRLPLPRVRPRRPPLDVAAREIELHGLDGARRSRSTTPPARCASSCACPASTTSTTRSPPRHSRYALGTPLDEIAAGLARFDAAFGRFERIAAGDRRVLMLLIKNPAGANEAVRTLLDGGSPATLVVALNDAIADGRDVSWIWDVDFEPLLAGSAAWSPPATVRPSSASGASTAACRRSAWTSSPISAAHSTAGSSSPRREASSSCFPPTRRCSGFVRSPSSVGSSSRTGQAA